MNNRQQALPLGGICDIQGAKVVARSIMESYDKSNKGYIDISEVPFMMVDAYKSINKGFNPS